MMPLTSSFSSSSSSRRLSSASSSSSSSIDDILDIVLVDHRHAGAFGLGLLGGLFFFLVLAGGGDLDRRLVGDRLDDVLALGLLDSPRPRLSSSSASAGTGCAATASGWRGRRCLYIASGSKVN